MTTEPPASDIKRLWRNQKTEGTTMTLENIHQRASKFQRVIRTRNLFEYGAVVLVIAVFAAYAWIFPGWIMKTGSALTILAALLVSWQLHRRGSARDLPGGWGIMEFHRRELVRQRDTLRAVWLWYLLPFVPGIALVMLSRWIEPLPWGTPAWDHVLTAFSTLTVVLVFGIVWVVNAREAAKLQKKIDELDELLEGGDRD